MKKGYFMYGLLVTYNQWMETKKSFSIADAMNFDVDDDVKGIFMGRNGEFVILGKELECETGEKGLLVVPLLEDVDKQIIENLVKERFGFEGKFHYYYITK